MPDESETRRKALLAAQDTLWRVRLDVAITHAKADKTQFLAGLAAKKAIASGDKAAGEKAAATWNKAWESRVAADAKLRACRETVDFMERTLSFITPGPATSTR